MRLTLLDMSYWALHPKLRDKSFSVRIAGTNCDGGWRYTEYEGYAGAFRGPADTAGMVKVHLKVRRPQTIEIPAQFVNPVIPIKDTGTKKAIVIFGDNIGSEVEVKNAKAPDDEWTVWNLASSSFFVCSCNHLAALPLIP
jgi:hypothetical protein